MAPSSWSRRAAAAAAAGLLGGCATMFTGTTDQLTFGANVPGVRLSIDGQYMGELPLALPMSRNFVGGRQFQARFERAGYQPQEFKLQREFNTVAILDVSSPITSGGIDLLTGSLLRFSPTGYQVQMLPEGQSASSPEFRREVQAWGLTLATWRAVQKDLARGGGEHLSAVASALADGDDAVRARIEAAALRERGSLLGACTPRELVARLDDALAAAPGTAGFRR